AREERTVARAELPQNPVAEQIMIMAATRKRHWTTAEVALLVDQREGYSPRYELVDGELLVTPGPSGRHQRIALELGVLLRDYVRRQNLGEVRLGPGEVALESENRFEPDIFVAPALNGRRAPANVPVTHPILVCEGLSPGSARHDRITKRHAFQRRNVPEYWVIDGNAEAIEVWRPGDARAMLVDDVLTWRPAGSSEPFSLNVKAFFAEQSDDTAPPND
ncbi:MAG TPA: Uma2 family endonuclease, partial [Gemmatimonadaceae bacterium]|nr:Uma2 family endonuclease [Gemmatimonadaceae bacterium]